MTSKLNEFWLRGLKDKEREDFETFVRNSTPVLEVLLKKLNQMEQEISEKESGESQYNSDWAFLQAHRNGKKEALKTLKGLLKHIQENP